MVMKRNTLFSLAILIMAGCQPASYEERVERAKVTADGNERTILLKNLAAENPKSAEVRFLLAKELHSVGDVPGATKEYEFALRNGYEVNEIIIPLLELYRLQEQNEEILSMDEFASALKPDTQAALNFYLGLSNLRLAKTGLASVYFKRVYEVEDNNFYGLMAKSYLNWIRGDFRAALDLVASALELRDNHPEALVTKAQLHVNRGEYNSAIDELNKAYNLTIRSHLVDILLAKLLLQNDRLNEAERHVNYLQSKFPELIAVNQLSALLAFKQSNFEQAKQFSETALQGGDDDPITRVIAGTANYQLQRYEQALQALEPLEEELIPSHPAFQLLIATRARIYETKKDGAAADGVKLNANDAKLLASSGIKLLARGENMEASAIATSLANADVDDKQALLQLGMLKIGLGDFSGLETVSSVLSDSRGKSKDNIEYLIAVLMLSKDFDEALNQLESALQNEPDSTKLLSLKARVLVASSRVEEGEALYAKVLKNQPDNELAQSYFAEKYISTRDYLRAKEALLSILNSNPNHLPSLSKLFFIAKETGDTSKLEPFIFGAYEANKNVIDYQILAAALHAENMQAEKVLKVLNLESLTQQSPNLAWRLWIDSTAYLGRVNESQEGALLWLKSKPTSREALSKALFLYEVDGRIGKALEILDTFIEKNGNTDLLSVLRINYQIQLGNVELASELFNAMPEPVQNSMPGRGLLGRLLLKRGQPLEALPHLLASYADSTNHLVTGSIIAAFASTRQFEKLEGFLEQHVENNSYDAKSRQVLAAYFSETAPEKALDHYTVLLEQLPFDTDVLNNYSWTLAKLGNYEKALSIIGPALENSRQAKYLDTLGFIYLGLERYEDAIAQFKEALNKEPELVETRLLLVDAFIQAGKVIEARELLEGINVTTVKQKDYLDRLKNAI